MRARRARLGAAGGRLEGALDGAADGVDDVGGSSLSFLALVLLGHGARKSSSMRGRDDHLHLRPHADVAERVLLPGDPGRALRLAQHLLDRPEDAQPHRGLWGYTGPAADGEPLTIQSTGMGGPSAAIVVEELIKLGARRLVRVGTCGALAGGLGLGEVLVADGALPRTAPAGRSAPASAVRPDPELLAALRRGAAGARRAGRLHRPLLRPRPERAEAVGARRGGRRGDGGAALFAVAARARRWPRVRAGRQRRRRRASDARIGDEAARGAPSARSATPRRRRSLATAGCGRFCRALAPAARLGRRRLVDLEALLLARHGRRGGVERCGSADTSAASLASWSSIAARRAGAAASASSASSRWSSRSTPSSMPSRRWETDRRRRVRRSTSAAEGMLSAPIAASCAWLGVLARLEGAGDRAVDQRVLQQVLRQLAQGVLALPREPVAQPVAVVHTKSFTVSRRVDLKARSRA